MAAIKVLIAEDDGAQRRLLRHYLQRWKYSVVEATDGGAAAAALQDPAIGLAILDWEMPVLTGLEVCRKLPALGRFVHAIMLTARSGPAELGEALAAGASDFLIKPVSPAELEARLRVGARVLGLLEQLAHHQNMKSVGSLAAGIAHEINTPVQALVSNLHFVSESWQSLHGALRSALDAKLPEIALDGLRLQCDAADLPFLEAEVPTALAEAGRAIERIGHIVGVIRRFCAPQDSPRCATSLNALVQDAVALTRPPWEHMAEFRADLDPALPPVPCSNSSLLQALCALLVNAGEAIARSRKGSERGKGKISVATARDATHALVHVADDGTGIAPEIQARIFDPFFTTKTVGEGLGQGLALVHSCVVGQHQGAISFQTEPGQGTTFTIRLPLQ